MTQKEIEGILKEIDKQIDLSLSNFTRFLENNEKDIIRLFEKVGLNAYPNGVIKTTIQNMKLIDSFTKSVAGLFGNVYKMQVTRLLKSFSGIRELADRYFSLLGETVEKKAYEELFKSNINLAVERLVNSGLNANYIVPVQNALKKTLSGNINFETMLGALKAEVSKGQNYLKLTANDSLNQFTANYIQTVSADLELKYYLYAGTKIEDTRDFCVTRAGKYYTEEEVKGWAKLSWQGKIPGTNESTIFSYRGGYNCRHFLLPVSKTIYKANV